MIDTGRLLVLYGSQSFTAQEAAERIWRTSKALGFHGPVQAMDDYPITRLIQEEFAIFVCATTGQGDEPDNMKKFWKFLLRKSLPANSLLKLKFGVLGFGDSSYSKFNFVSKKLHRRLLQLGATPLIDIGLCDYQHDLGHDAVMQPWVKDYFSHLKAYFPNIHIDNLKDNFIPRWTVSLLKSDFPNENNNSDIKIGVSRDIYFGKGRKKDFLDANLLEVENNIRTTDESHFQDVRMISFKTTGDLILNYKPGDVFNIRPRNSTEDIEDLFSIFAQHNMDIKSHYRLLVEEIHEAISTTEAEIVAASETAREIVWLIKLFNEITALKEKPILQVDNDAAVKLAQNPELHRRTKHIAIRHFYVRELVADGIIQVNHVGANLQDADFLTKPLSRPSMESIMNRIGLGSL